MQFQKKQERKKYEGIKLFFCYNTHNVLSSTTRLKLFSKKKKQNAEEALLQETSMEYIFVVKM